LVRVRLAPPLQILYAALSTESAWSFVREVSDVGKEES
jgi:hypothetical protein